MNFNSHFSGRSEWILCILCMQHLLQFTLIPLELYLCLGHGLKMCILFRYHPQIIFCHFFHKMNLVIFPAEVNRYFVSCVCNSSYSFTPIPLKLYMHLGHEMCILFRYHPQIIFCHLLHKMKLVIFQAEVNRYFCVCNSSYCFTPIPLKLYRCLGHGLKMCIFIPPVEV